MAKSNEVVKASEKKVATKKRSKFNLKAIFSRIGRFFREVVAELKKVSWPTRAELTSYTIAVLIFVAIFGVITFAIDSGLSAALNLLLK